MLELRSLKINLQKEKKNIALFSGIDNMPVLLWKKAKARGDKVFPILFSEFSTLYPSFWQSKEKNFMPIGQLGKIINFLKDHHISHFIIAGKLERLPLKKLQLDLTAKIFLAKNIGIYAKGDNALLLALAQFVKKKTNSTMLSPTDYLQDKEVLKKGLFAGTTPKKLAWQDFKKGQKILATLSKFDIAQGIVMGEGLILSIEAMAGTDAMIRAAKDFTKQREAVLVKDFKKGQSKDLDAPSIGPNTINEARRAGLQGIFLNHRGNVIEPMKVKKLADKYKIFVWLF